ncbi:uncharacterized protein (TIGR00369 family) [Propionicimonas paludicola]|uniref:Uncharacterized protein (TIGR00369 family) n=1 Tax=Propionicimonas paludicola TaxID=185243 RepID=A0A2A9CS99_9ACTN|nr:PaaI family thioesterase [Propionicimonas paludicola]PFG16955.1 uncharacterized protein (TIGR00369 family) [Propionicimonas paludicola]
MDPAQIAQLPLGPLAERMGLELLHLEPARAEGRCPVAGNTQPFGLWHGGASCVLAETLASVAAIAEVGPDGRAAGVELNATHLAAARDGWVHGTAEAIRIGRTLATYQVELRDDAGTLVCVARVTVSLQRAATS